MNSPAIRFAGFTEDWEQRKLFDAIKKIIDFRGRTPKKIGLDWSESGYLALSALNVKDGYIDITADANFGSQELYDRWMDGHELRKGQVLFTTEAPMGNVAQVPDNAGYILSQRTIAFDVDPEIIIEDFLFTLLRSPNMFRALSALSSGGTAKGVSQKSMSQIDTIIPKNLEEQTQLAAFFISLDRLITLHQCKHDKTVNIKKALLEKMFPKDGEDKPEIRFSGFTDAWERRKFDTFFDIIPNNTLSRARLSYGEGEIKSVHYGDILIKYGAVTDCITDEIPFITEAKASEYRSAYLQNGDVLIADTAEDETVGKTTELTGITNIPVVSGLHTIACRPKIKMHKSYLGYFLNSPSFHKQLLPLMQGIKVLSISRTNLGKTLVNYPAATQEQAKIGQTFANLDRLITLHKRELTKFQNIKKALLEKMFV